MLGIVASRVPIPRAAPPLIPWDEAARFGAAVAVTTRYGGVSPPPYETLNLGLHVGDQPDNVAANRARVAGAFGVGLGTMVFARQVHGARAVLVGPEDCGRGVATEDDAVADTDILVTSSPGVTLVMLVADCVPLALVDPAAGVLAAVHAGWRGTAAGRRCARRWPQCETAVPAPIGWWRSWARPSIPRRYQVSDEVPHALAEAVHPAPLEPAVARPDGPGHWLVDLDLANRQQLRAEGVRAEHIFGSGATTDDDPYFSDRARRPCGRFGLLARLLG